MPAKSKAQQRFFGMIDAYKKGKMKHAPKKIRDAAKHISDEDARDFAKTKHEGLPEKVAHIICSRRMEKKADDNSHPGRNGMIAGALAGGGLEALLQNEAFKLNGMNRSYLANDTTLRQAYEGVRNSIRNRSGYSNAAKGVKQFVNKPWVFKDEMRALGDPMLGLAEWGGKIFSRVSPSVRKDMLKLRLAKILVRGGNIAAKAGAGAAAVGVPMALLGAMTRRKAPAPAPSN